MTAGLPWECRLPRHRTPASCRRDGSPQIPADRARNLLGLDAPQPSLRCGAAPEARQNGMKHTGSPDAHDQVTMHPGVVSPQLSQVLPVISEG